MKFVAQHDQMDCGPACLSMIAGFYGRKYSLKYLRDHSFLTREGVSLAGISEAAQTIGMEAVSAQLTLDVLATMPLPCVLHWNKNHFVVLHKIVRRPFSSTPVYKIADPGYGMITLSEEDFKKSWFSDGNTGVALILEPLPEFYSFSIPAPEVNLSLGQLVGYLRPYKKQVWFMFLLLFSGSVITFALPFLTQNLIDKGVHGKDLNLISLILLAQLGLFLGTLFIGVIRNWLMLYVGAKINITIISDYLRKLLKLPVRFFETKMMGDFNQRIQDHERIEIFLTSQSLLTIFSMLTFSAFMGVLWYYNYKILSVYLFLTILSVLWSYSFLRRRRILDYYRFQRRSENQESIYEIINGVTEMKLSQLEDFKRSNWEKIQRKLFKINIRILKLDQLQSSVFDLINQVKNIIVTFLSATYVVKGHMTLGELLSVSFIIGQMNAPVNQLVSFFRSLQDAKLSLERLNEIQLHQEEEQPFLSPVSLGGIFMKDVSFRYGSSTSPLVLKNINLNIPYGKTTAIVGASGSGKTTLMKLLLKFYEPTSGAVFFDHLPLSSISPLDLRENCGVVMQDGFIFSDTIERNIIAGGELDPVRFRHAVRIANITDFIESLPLKANTKIGAAGNGISGGQKQRILIARAVYKNPHYFLLDEATSALDAENEKIIQDNLLSFFKGKTVVIIAHRLSTVKNADQIVVLKNGEIVEQGSHLQLVQRRSEYFSLVQNQLELGL
ncbi:ATP-binding cassette, subfamily B [Chitinophaga rupis]|uniref:ATP-binding cassette, subfamily B n=1 Tax=Chitinophaga rupis TaxID=573321 RepID=A0A1H7ZU89_9BACT|nr:peptidase domain-containing ABC transporter [Chitinophaga rupis]SEM61354.1 ATP-binding cassette, subfamily B [Chitinophaga rupis]